MSTQALLVIDVQTGFIEGEWSMHTARTMLERIKGLVAQARAADVPVIFIRHDEEPEKDWPLHPELGVQPDDIVIAKLTPDSFHKTDLQATLDRLGVRQVVIAGFQTEYCIQTTTRRAATLGYEVTLAGDAHSTTDSTLPAPETIAQKTAELQQVATVKPAVEIVFG